MEPCDGWSDQVESPGAGSITPMFPLPNVFLFPGLTMPLHIFEPRYRQMIEDSLDGPGRIVMATIDERCHDQVAGSPPVHHIAGLGEIMRHERLPDGRFLIMLVGLGRVLIREIPSDRLYRKVEAIPLRERPLDEALAPGLRDQLVQAIAARSPEPLELRDDVPLGQLADILLLLTQPPQSQMQSLFSCVVVEDRVKGALGVHTSVPLPARRPRKGPPSGGMA